jgi:ribosome-associated heat shock protein Hsp15
MPENVRIDKFLWATRLFKTRSISTDECKKGRVLITDMPVKPSRIVKIGDTIQIKCSPIIRTYKVLGIIEKRVSASLAKENITETTSEDELLKIKLAVNTYVKRDFGSGRPTKKERRLIDKFNESEL